MATVRGVLGQSVPAATILTDVYTVPASKTAVVRVIATNTSNADTRFRVAVAPNGDPDALKHYIAYDVVVSENDTGSTIQCMIAAGTVVRCRGDNGAVAFTVTGLEQDV